MRLYGCDRLRDSSHYRALHAKLLHREAIGRGAVCVCCLSQLALLPPNTTVAAVPQDVCPSTPGEIDFTTPTNKQGISSEKLESSITGNSVTVTLDRNSRLLKKRGFAALCIVDNDCVDPVAKPCVKQLGTAKWKGPTASPYTEQLCEQLEAGRCRVTVAGFEMTSLDYGVPRLALSRSCGVSLPTLPVLGTLRTCLCLRGLRCCSLACVPHKGY